MVHALETEARDLHALSGTVLLASRVLQAPPDEGLVREALNLIAEIDDADPQRCVAGAAAREEVRRALEALAGDPDAVEAAEVAFAQLFYGVGVRPVPLVESVYTSEEHVLYDRAYLAVREAYAEAGFESDGAFEQPADDLCVELAFASFLLVGAAEGDANCAGALARFCREHLGAWAPAAVADLRGAATHPLYLAAADLVTALLAALRG